GARIPLRASSSLLALECRQPEPSRDLRKRRHRVAGSLVDLEQVCLARIAVRRVPDQQVTEAHDDGEMVLQLVDDLIVVELSHADVPGTAWPRRESNARQSAAGRLES